MKTIITYITDDGQEFDNIFSARRHECELTQHTWEFYTKNMGLQKQMDYTTHMQFCKKCQKQEILEREVINAELHNRFIVQN
jgi:hypothetical protein